MSMFYCENCDMLCDADDGCEEVPGNKLICADCAMELEAEREQIAEEEAADRAAMVNVGGHRNGGSAS